MDIPTPEHRRVKITTDTRPSSISKLAVNLAHAHPFVQQIDLILPTENVKEDAFVGLTTRYYRAKVSLSNATDEAGPFGSLFLNPDRCLTMLSVDDNSDDVWCIDHRGILTLSVSKLTYERLGLVGTKLPFKGRDDQYVISVDLRNKSTETVGNRARRIEALKSWDKQREQEGHGLWNVLLSVQTDDSATILSSIPDIQAHEVTANVTRTTDIHIPSAISTSCPSLDEDHGEDWNADMACLFEWVGLAALGSQRLRADDRTDPFIAVYECPSPSYVGDLMHFRWTGFLSSSFVQKLVTSARSSVESVMRSERRPFIAIASHGISMSPVAFIPLPTHEGKPRSTPMHFPRPDGEDTWSLVLTTTASSEPAQWVLAESVGQYDTRWG